MTLERDLALRVLEGHPLAAARVLERLPTEEAARFLASVDPPVGAAVVRVMHGPAAAAILTVLDDRRAAAVLGELSPDVASALLRRLDEPLREQLLGEIGGRRARSLRSLLRFAPETAGSLMDPDVLALPVDLSVAEALVRVREAAREARYNVYGVDRDQRLVGALNLRELFLADPDTPLSDIVHPNPHCLPASADRHAIVSHPGWLEVHSLPVVDRNGVYLGAIRYRTLRQLEEEVLGVRRETGATARALGDLFRTGAASVLEAVAASADDETPGRAGDVA